VAVLTGEHAHPQKAAADGTDSDEHRPHRGQRAFAVVLGHHDIVIHKPPALGPGIQQGQQEQAQYYTGDGVVERDDGGQHLVGHHSEQVQPPADHHATGGAGEDCDDNEDTGLGWYPGGGSAPHEQAPHPIGDVCEREVADEAEEAAGPDAPEEVADDGSYRRAPCGGGTEEQPCDHRYHGCGAHLSEPGDDRDRLQRNDERGVDRGAERRKHGHLGATPHDNGIPQGGHSLGPSRLHK